MSDTPATPAPAATPGVTDSDPGGLAASVQVAVASVLLAVGFADPEVAKWGLAAQAVVSLATQLWARRRAWAPATVAATIASQRQAIGEFLRLHQAATTTSPPAVPPNGL